MKKQAKKIVASAPGDDFAGLIQSLTHVHEYLKFQAAKAVNINLTLRNWVFGWRIKEYELKGRDRAKYGEGLFAAIAKRLTGLGVPNCAQLQLYRYCRFYLAFPEILGTLYPKLDPSVIFGTVSRKSDFLPARQEKAKVGILHPQSNFLPDKLLSELSYSHLQELSEVEAAT